MRRGPLLLVTACAASAPAGCTTSSTELVVSVHADVRTAYQLPAGSASSAVLAELRVEAASVGEGEPAYREVERETFETASNAALTLVLDAAHYDLARPVAVRAVLTLRDGRTLTRRALVKWRKGQRIQIDLGLARACLEPARAAACAPGSECGNLGRCEPLEAVASEVARAGVPFH